MSKRQPPQAEGVPFQPDAPAISDRDRRVSESWQAIDRLSFGDGPEPVDREPEDAPDSVE